MHDVQVVENLEAVRDGLEQHQLCGEAQRRYIARLQPGEVHLLGHLVVLRALAEEVQGGDQVAAVAGQRAHGCLNAAVVRLEGGAAGAFPGLRLGAAGGGVVGVGGGEEPLDEIRPTVALGEAPLAQSGADHPEVLHQPIAVQHVPCSHGVPSVVPGPRKRS